MRIRMADLTLAAALSLLCADLAAAQIYPSRPVTFVVPFAPGGSTDTVARIVAQAVGPALGQPTVVENRTGGAGTVGWGAVARSAPDGYTLSTHRDVLRHRRRPRPHTAVRSEEELRAHRHRRLRSRT